MFIIEDGFIVMETFKTEKLFKKKKQKKKHHSRYEEYPYRIFSYWSKKTYGGISNENQQHMF